MLGLKPDSELVDVTQAFGRGVSKGHTYHYSVSVMVMEHVMAQHSTGGGAGVRELRLPVLGGAAARPDQVCQNFTDNPGRVPFSAEHHRSFRNVTSNACARKKKILPKAENLKKIAT